MPGPCDIETAAKKGLLYAIFVRRSGNERCKDAGAIIMCCNDPFLANLLLPSVVAFSLSIAPHTFTPIHIS